MRQFLPHGHHKQSRNRMHPYSPQRATLCCASWAWHRNTETRLRLGRRGDPGPRHHRYCSCHHRHQHQYRPHCRSHRCRLLGAQRGPRTPRGALRRRRTTDGCLCGGKREVRAGRARPPRLLDQIEKTLKAGLGRPAMASPRAGSVPERHVASSPQTHRMQPPPT